MPRPPHALRGLPVLHARFFGNGDVREAFRKCFLREHASKLTGDALLLYFFLAAVSDKQGLSFYSDTTIAVRLRMREEAVVSAREELITYDLAAYQPPLTQVLSLPRGRLERRGLPALENLFRSLNDPGS